jgi:hypothetical protein
MTTPVYLEIGSSKTFACALDWPGWCRAGRDEHAALEALAAYADRYRPVAEMAGVRFARSAGDGFEVVERVTGDATTNFGAPGRPSDADSKALTAKQAERLASLVAASWAVFDRVVKDAPPDLRKGPRGGGRDRDKMAAHVAAAEAAYLRKVGVRTGRADFLDALRAARRPQPDLATKSWPWRYAARRVAWHALDHAWEIEDRSQ